MKLTKTKLKQIIKEEFTNIKESREEHVVGISNKIDRLKDAVDNARRGMENMEAGAQMPGASEDEIHYNLMDVRSRNEYWVKQQEISNLEDKITLLVKQLQQLQQPEPGQLERPEGF